MVEPGVQAAFFEEGFDRARIVPELLIQAFDRDDAVEKQVAGLADAADSPARLSSAGSARVVFCRAFPASTTVASISSVSIGFFSELI